MATRIYKVTSNTGIHLVRSPTRSQAIAFIAKTEIDANVATQEDIVSHLGQGRGVVDVKEEQLPLTLGDE